MQSINRWLYGPSPEEKVKKWKQTLRTQERQLDREINNVSAAAQYHSSRRTADLAVMQR